MFSRKSNSNGEGLPSPRSGERTPLRSVLNEMPHNSSPSSRLKPRSLPTSDVLKMTMGDIPASNPVPRLHCAPPTEVIDATFPKPSNKAPTRDAATPETACGLGDITFKSFICTGGDVEIPGPSTEAEDPIDLPPGQLANKTCDGERTFITDSMINQSCGDHVEHPYCDAERDATSVDVDAGSLCEVSNTRPVSRSADDDIRATEESRIVSVCSGQEDVTFKSFNCYGAEVDVSEATRLSEETIPLPEVEVCSHFPDEDVNPSILMDDGHQQCREEHADHLYCNNRSNLASSGAHFSHISEGSSGIEKPASGLSDVTFKSFNCYGPEVDVSEASRLSEETIPLPEVEVCSHFPDEDVNPSILMDDGHQQCREEHADHLYCNNGSNLASSRANFSHTSEGSSGIEKPASGLSDVPFKSFVCTRGEVEVSDATKIADETVPLPIGQFVSSVMCSDDLSYVGEPLPCSLVAMNEEEKRNLASAGCQTDRQGDITFRSFICTGGEVELSDATGLPQVTIPLPKDQSGTCLLLCNDSVHASIMQMHHEDHSEHPYYHVEHNGAVSGIDSPPINEPSMVTTSVESVKGLDANREVGIDPPAIGEPSMVTTSVESVKDLDGNCEVGIDPPAISKPSMVTTSVESVKDLDGNCEVGIDPPAIDEPSMVTTSVESVKDLDADCVDLKQGSLHAEDGAVPSRLEDAGSSNCDEVGALGRSSTPVKVQEGLGCNSDLHSRGEALESSGATDSAFGSTGNGPVASIPLEELPAEKTPDALTVLPKVPSKPNAVQFEFLSPIVRGTPVARIRLRRESAFARALDEDSVLELEKSLVAAVKLDPSLLPRFGPLESPMPQPMFNSTALTRSTYKPQSAPVKETAADERPCVVAQCQVEEGVVDIPMIPDGPLQQQLRQMAALLLAAAGKVGAAPGPPPAAAVLATPTERHSVCVGTTPAVKLVDHSLNTSGQFERKREFSVVDSCTMTDAPLWNMPPGGLESLSRQELEQRLRNSVIMVEALVQQRATVSCPAMGPGPSSLRDALVQTDHTELDQTTTYRDLYMTALNTIGELELDQTFLRNLIQSLQDTRASMTTLRSDTDSALSNMKHIGDMVREDQDNLVTQYDQMKSFHLKFKETQARMVQKVKDSLQQREDMREQMEEALAAKQAAFSVTEQLRAHCDERISSLEESVGSHQELMTALNRLYPEQVSLNKAYVETLNSASDLLTGTLGDQACLAEELQVVRGLLDRTGPMLLKLKEKAATALRESDQHMSDRDQAVEERDQIQEELNQTYLNLQDAEQQIGDLNLQMTILNSEMGVFREKLSGGEVERAQLQRKVTELSATISSTMASYAFLEQALNTESTKLQQSWKEAQDATDKATELEVSLGRSEQRVCELSQALVHSEDQLSQLQAHSHAQSLQVQQLQDVCKQLNNANEMNEFMQMENELAREQVVESEKLLRVNLQGLRERNIQCEDLKGVVSQLQGEKAALWAEVQTTRSRAEALELDLGEQLAQAVTDVTLLHYTLQGLTAGLHAALSDKKPDPMKDKATQPSLGFDRSQRPTSFVDRIMGALSGEKGEDTETPTGQDSLDVPEPQCEGLFSGMSAFTRIPITPKRSLLGELEAEAEAKVEACSEEEQRNVVELLADLGNTVAELVSTLTLVQQHKDAQLEELHDTICSLQGEQQAQASRHVAEVSELKEQLGHHSSSVEKGNLALQQKGQDDKTIKKLFAEVSESRELLSKYKTDNAELRKEVADVHGSLQQSHVESQALREELVKSDGQSATPEHFMNEKIRLLKEVDRHRESLQKMEQGKNKLLERAKRHQMIHQANEQKMESELRVLDTMINRVRKTLLSLPEVVNNCEKLKQLAQYIG